MSDSYSDFSYSYDPPPTPTVAALNKSTLSLNSGHHSLISVPPSTPNSDFSFRETFLNSWPKLEPATPLPYIREVGVKSCLETLSDHFQFSKYKQDAIQFWFLDVVADCLWRAQDEFQFPQEYQRIILNWVLYVSNIIRDPTRNITRKNFFKIFNEALIIAEEHIQNGCETLPEPDELFIFPPEEEQEKVSLPSSSEEDDEISSFQESMDSRDGSYLGIGIDEEAQFFKLPESKCICKYIPTPHDSSEEDEDGDEECLNLYDPELAGFDINEFYQPDPNLPARFIQSNTSSSESADVYAEPSMNKILNNINNQAAEENADDEPVDLFARFTWDKSSSSSTEKTRRTCPHAIFENKTKSDSNVMPENQAVADNLDGKIKREWIKYLDGQEMVLKDVEKRIFINTCALYAVKQFVYDYFYETFQFMLIKLAFIGNYHIIAQRVNKTWMVPKKLKEELKKPKIPKEKKPKKKKDRKKSKKSKKGSKKSKKKDKKSKKSKKSSKKDKKKKLTKEEREALARLKKELERLEELARKAEDNRRLLFPLKEAASEEFYKSIFEHWVKPKDKKKKKGKKGKKGKKK